MTTLQTYFSAFACGLSFFFAANTEDVKPLAGLNISYGPRGVEQISYRGQVVEDIVHWPEDSFHIWHMKCTDASSGRLLTSNQYGWGENNKGRVWNAHAKTWTYVFEWGTLTSAFSQLGDTLNVTVTAANHANSGVIFDGAAVYPLTLHLPQASLGTSGMKSRLVDGFEEPGVTLATWSQGVVAVVAPQADTPIWSGFQAAEDGALVAVLSGTRPDGLTGATGARPGLHVPPGGTVSVRLSIRFASNVAFPTLAQDALEDFSRRWPTRLNWKDRRIIATVYLASSNQGDKTHTAGFPTNPRRFFNETSVNVRDLGGLAQFQTRILHRAEAAVQNLHRLNAQGLIIWDIEGEEYPQDTSYVCAPDAIAQVAPEMESVVSDPTSRYAGMKLDDAFFKIIRDAGLRVGVCVRPQRFTLWPDGSAQQVSVLDPQAAAELKRKMHYAHDRWGATLFYLDSTVREDGSALPAEILEDVAESMPDSLLIPEEVTVRAYRATAPFLSFLFHGDLGTDAKIRALYPHAFTANLVNDVDSGKLAAHRSSLLDSVRYGDILMVHGDLWQANNATVADIQREASTHH